MLDRVDPDIVYVIMKDIFMTKPALDCLNAGKHVFIFNEKGLMQVVDTTVNEGEVVGKLDLDDQILATPAIANGAIYARSNTKIYKVAK